ncbi:MAG TPA: NUDIX domain-containing protein [Cellulomonas sp.]
MAVTSAGLVLYRRPAARDEGSGSLGLPNDRGALPDESPTGHPAPRRLLSVPVGSRAAGVEVLCAHMGGPLWARKDERAWSFPKGLVEDGEDEIAAARREFVEELGVPAPDEPSRRLGAYRYSSGKVVVLFAVEADLAVEQIVPGTFEMQWPPRSGHRQAFPEVDRAAWFDLPTARAKLVAGQAPALDDLERLLGG